VIALRRGARSIAVVGVLAALAGCSSSGGAAARTVGSVSTAAGRETTTATTTTTSTTSTTPPTTLPPTTVATTTTAPPTTSPPTTPAAPAPPRTSCTAVVHIGDSTSVGLMSPAYLADPALRIDAQYARVGATDFRNEISGARSTEERLKGQQNAVEVAQRQRASGYHGCWVVALGNTDAANIAVGSRLTAAARIDRMFAVIGDVDPVLWVTPKTLRTSGPYANLHMAAWNAELVAATARHPNLRIYDWASVVQDDWYQRDGIHYTSAGYTERARLIADALAAAFPA
jgi:hypothetical protein